MGARVHRLSSVLGLPTLLTSIRRYTAVAIGDLPEKGRKGTKGGVVSVLGVAIPSGSRKGRGRGGGSEFCWSSWACNPRTGPVKLRDQSSFFNFEMAGCCKPASGEH